MKSHQLRVVKRTLPFLLVAMLAASAPGCGSSATDAAPPGDSLGTFHVTATLTNSDCGAGAGAPDSHEFDITLSQDANAIYWTQFGTTVVGSLDGDEATWLYQGPDQTDGACTLEQQQTFKATLDDVAHPSSLKGTIVEDIVPATGADCAQEAAGGAGAFDNLPCTVTYEFSAKRQ